MAEDSEKTDRMRGRIKALSEVSEEEDISEIDTQVEQLSFENFEKKRLHVQMSYLIE